MDEKEVTAANDDKLYNEFFKNNGEVTQDENDGKELGSDQDAASEVAESDEREVQADASENDVSYESSEAEVDEPEKPVVVAEKKTNESDNYKKALQEERQRRKEAQRQADEIRIKNDSLQKTLERILDKANEKDVPSYDDDPLAAVKHELEETKKTTKELKEDKEQQQRAQQEQAQFKSFIADYSNRVDEYAKSQPDFDGAYKFLINSRLTEYMESGLTKDEAQSAVQQDEAQIAWRAMQNDVNPGERLYKLAKLRGYTQEPSTPPKNVAADKAKQISNGLQASHRVNAGGVNTQGKLTPEAIAAMDDEEFSKFDWKKLSKMM